MYLSHLFNVVLRTTSNQVAQIYYAIAIDMSVQKQACLT